MRFAPTLAALLLAGLPGLAAPAGSGDDAGDLVGVWRLRSFSLDAPGEGPREVFGPQPRGYLIFTPEGRMMTILTRPDRRPAVAPAEQAALLQSMVAYTGRYTVEDDRVTVRPDVSWNEAFTGTVQVRYYVVAGDTLSMRTAEQPSVLLPGRRVVATLVYERER
jgi:hypothetical protein